MRRFGIFLLFSLVFALPAATPALAQAPDTTHKAPPFFTWRDGLLLAGLGGLALAMDPLDVHFAHVLQDSANQQNHFLHRMATTFRLMGQPAPQIIGVGLYAVGRATHNQKIEKLAVHGVEAMLLGTAVTTGVKFVAGRARPSKDPNKHLGFGLFRGFKGYDYQSFPSGHATTAFSVASAATDEYAHWADEWHSPGYTKFLVGSVLYGGATLVGLSRMYNNAHWASDVATGALVGTFAGIKTVEYNYRHPGNKVERWLVKLQVVPGQGHSPTWIGFSVGPGTFDAPARR